MIEKLEPRQLLSSSTFNLVVAVAPNSNSGVLTVFGARNVTLTAQADGSVDVNADGQTCHAVAWGNEGQGIVPIIEVDVLATAPGSNLIVLNTNDAHPISALIQTGSGSDALIVTGTGTADITFDGGQGHDFLFNFDANASICLT